MYVYCCDANVSTHQAMARHAELLQLLFTLGRGLKVFVDSGVDALLFSRLGCTSLALETSGMAGLQLLLQWDDLLLQQKWSGFLMWPTPVPSGLLPLKDKVKYISHLLQHTRMKRHYTHL